MLKQAFRHTVCHLGINIIFIQCLHIYTQNQTKQLPLCYVKRN